MLSRDIQNIQCVLYIIDEFIFVYSILYTSNKKNQLCWKLSYEKDCNIWLDEGGQAEEEICMMIQTKAKIEIRWVIIKYFGGKLVLLIQQKKHNWDNQIVWRETCSAVPKQPKTKINCWEMIKYFSEKLAVLFQTY